MKIILKNTDKTNLLPCVNAISTLCRIGGVSDGKISARFFYRNTPDIRFFSDTDLTKIRTIDLQLFISLDLKLISEPTIYCQSKHMTIAQFQCPRLPEFEWDGGKREEYLISLIVDSEYYEKAHGAFAQYVGDSTISYSSTQIDGIPLRGMSAIVAKSRALFIQKLLSEMKTFENQKITAYLTPDIIESISGSYHPVCMINPYGANCSHNPSAHEYDYSTSDVDQFYKMCSLCIDEKYLIEAVATRSYLSWPSGTGAKTSASKGNSVRMTIKNGRVSLMYNYEKYLDTDPAARNVHNEISRLFTYKQ